MSEVSEDRLPADPESLPRPIGDTPGSVDTIFAPASGFGRAAIAVMRISGPHSRAVLERLAGPLPRPRRASLRTLVDNGVQLDQGLVLWLPGPGSFTGEDQAELHIHGGLAVRQAVLRALAEQPGCRAAEPGEFTRRAFLAGRLDLTAVEGLADLINAETEAQRRQALRQLEGGLRAVVEGWRDEAIGALAFLEAALDFADEEIPPSLIEDAARKIERLRDAIHSRLAGSHQGERLREGFRVVLAGPPNAGKSTLLNAIARRDVAIVSAIPGTTRDAIEVRCDLDGLPVTFVDTAGLRETLDVVELLGVERTRGHIEAADLVLWLVPALGAERTPQPPGSVAVGTKADLGGPSDLSLVVSSLTGKGLPDLLSFVRGEAEAALGLGDALITRERHRSALARAEAALGRALETLSPGREELAAEDVRIGLRALGEITGRVGVEDVLDRLFSSFCIGK